MVKAARSKEKGNEFEWLIARRLSVWMHPTGENTELIRSVQSGGWAGRNNPQVGDLAPNGEYGARFRSVFSVECKHWKEINWWWVFNAPKHEFMMFWRQTREEALEAGLIPLYIVRQNRMPIMVCVPERYMLHSLYPAQDMMMTVHHLQMSVVPLDAFLTVKPEWYYEYWHPVGGG